MLNGLKSPGLPWSKGSLRSKLVTSLVYFVPAFVCINTAGGFHLVSFKSKGEKKTKIEFIMSDCSDLNRAVSLWDGGLKLLLSGARHFETGQGKNPPNSSVEVVFRCLTSNFDSNP